MAEASRQQQQKAWLDDAQQQQQQGCKMFVSGCQDSAAAGTTPGVHSLDQNWDRPKVCMTQSSNQPQVGHLAASLKPVV
jgi:hypothetical protein